MIAMIKNFEIKPGYGFDSIKLGMTREEIVKAIGKPHHTEKTKHDEGGDAETYYYENPDFDLSFESEDGYRLSYISVESTEFHISGKIKMGDSQEAVLAALKELNFDEPLVDEEADPENPNQTMVNLEEENIDLWFNGGILDEIQFGPFWEDDDTPVWPK